MLKEIGSNFWIDTSKVKKTSSKYIDMKEYGISGDDTVLLSTGRAAISFALDDIKNTIGKRRLKALIPPYTCHTVVKSFIDKDIDVVAYDIEEKLGIDPDKFEQILSGDSIDIVLIHRYFGFDTVDGIQDCIRKFRSDGCAFIEDRTQNLFSDFMSLPVDYIIGSFRKWGPIPDGGYCVKTDGLFSNSESMGTEDRELVKRKLDAFQLKFDYMEKGEGEKSVFLRVYGEAEKILDEEKRYYRMSSEAVSIFNNLNKIEIKNRRKQNYDYVYKNLNNKIVKSLTPKIRNDSVPLYLAMISEKRDVIQAFLREHNIYAPVVWPKSDILPKVSDGVDNLYKKVLCLPIDQRYKIDDMERMVNLINTIK